MFELIIFISIFKEQKLLRNQGENKRLTGKGPAQDSVQEQDHPQATPQGEGSWGHVRSCWAVKGRARRKGKHLLFSHFIIQYFLIFTITLLCEYQCFQDASIQVPVHFSSNVSSFFDYNAFNVAKSQKRNWNSHLHVAAQTSGSWIFGKRRAQDGEALLHLLWSIFPSASAPFQPHCFLSVLVSATFLVASGHLHRLFTLFPGTWKGPPSRTSSLVLLPAWVSELLTTIMKWLLVLLYMEGLLFYQLEAPRILGPSVSSFPP